jgi:hypothetical protein
MAVTADKPAPYTPPKAIVDIIDRYRHRGLPKPLNAEVLTRAGVPESVIPRTLQALPVLGLVDDEGNPTPTLEGLRLAPESEFKSKMEEWVKGAYADVFAFVDPTKDDEIAIRDAFRNYQPVGQQARMVTLFVGLCNAAGLIRSKDGAGAAPSRSTRPRSTPSTSAAPKRAVSKPPKPPVPDTGGAFPAPVAGMLTKLPPDGQGWTKAARDRFMTAFGAVIDFTYPIVEEDSESEAAAAGKAAAA